METEESNTRGQNNSFQNISFIKTTFLAQVLVIPNQIIDGLQQMQKYFLWNSSSPKVKHETICKDVQHGRLKKSEFKDNKFAMLLD